jgi:hypothetical protein
LLYVFRVLTDLCSAESFTEAAVHYLSVLWDQEEDEVLNTLEELGWTEGTGGVWVGWCGFVFTHEIASGVRVSKVSPMHNLAPRDGYMCVMDEVVVTCVDKRGIASPFSTRMGAVSQLMTI